MKDKERLELLENGSSFSSDDITFLLKQARLYQISRDDTREKCHEVRQQNKELEQQNKRYREAIEYVMTAKSTHYSSLENALEDIKYVINEVLERDSE